MGENASDAAQSVSTVEITATDDEIHRALMAANIPALMATIAFLTGDMKVVRGAIRPMTLPLAETEDALEEYERQAVRDMAFEAIAAYRDRGGSLPPLPSVNEVREIITFLTGELVPEGYMPVLEEELALGGGLQHRTFPINGPIADDVKQNFRVLVIGSGMSGILAAIRLKQAGIPYLVVDKNAKVGGTWYENTYPGCRVDSPNHLYTYLFERNDDWPCYFSTREALAAYFEQCADRYDLRGSIRLETQVKTATFDDEKALWQVELEGPGGVETLEFSAIITAIGQLNAPKIPDYPGLEKFKGVYFHSARWEHEHDLRGKRVVSIGTGASSTQFVPEIAPKVEQLTVFQRSAPWLIPTPDYYENVPEGQLWLFRHVPYYANWYRTWLFRRDAADGSLPFLFADPSWNNRSKAVGPANEQLRQLMEDYIREQVKDRPDLLEKVIPDYPPGGKRMLRDNGSWLATMKRDNVDLETAAIREITETGVITEDGREIPADVIIFGTGFHADTFLRAMDITGREGRKLSDEWADGPRAYKGISVPGFPNLFVLYGPNTNIVVGSSIIFFSECEMRYVMGCLRLLLEKGRSAMDCRRAVHDAYNEKIDADNLNTAWGAPGVKSWYKDKNGRVTQNWPGTHLQFWQTTKEPDPADYEFL